MPNQLLTTGAAPYLYSVHGMTKYTSSFSLIYNLEVKKKCYCHPTIRLARVQIEYARTAELFYPRLHILAIDTLRFWQYIHDHCVHVPELGRCPGVI